MCLALHAFGYAITACAVVASLPFGASFLDVPLHAATITDARAFNTYTCQPDFGIRRNTCEDFECDEADCPHVCRAFKAYPLRAFLQRTVYLGCGVTPTRYVVEQNSVADVRRCVEAHELPCEIRLEPHDVRGVQIPVNNPLRMHLCNGLKNLHHTRQHRPKEDPCRTECT